MFLLTLLYDFSWSFRDFSREYSNDWKFDLKPECFPLLCSTIFFMILPWFFTGNIPMIENPIWSLNSFPLLCSTIFHDSSVIFHGEYSNDWKSDLKPECFPLLCSTIFHDSSVILHGEYSVIENPIEAWMFSLLCSTIFHGSSVILHGEYSNDWKSDLKPE